MTEINIPAGEPLHAALILIFSLVVLVFICVNQPKMPKCGWCGRCDECQGKRSDIQRGI